MFEGYDREYYFYAKDETDYQIERTLNPSDIYIIKGYKIDVYAEGLNAPIGMVFNEEGEILLAESGLADGNPRILRYRNKKFEVIAEGFNIPVTGINYLNGVIYVSHRGYVTKLYEDGTRENIIAGLPSNGDHYNSPVTFSPDKKLYFGQGTVTNSGFVGNDNYWVPESPLLCDYAGGYIMLYGQNFETNNIFTESLPDDTALTGAFSPYGIPNLPYESRKKFIKASGSILRSNLDGSNLEQVAWGFRNPAYLKYDNSGRLFVANDGYQPVGSRPIENASDEFFYVSSEGWYGWPDYSGGEEVTLPRFRPSNGPQPTLLLKNQPNVPPMPFVLFPPNSTIRGFDFNYNLNFGPYGDAYIAEYGSTFHQKLGEISSYTGAGHRISRIDMKSRTISTFAINKTGFSAAISKDGGFERPSHLLFGPDDAMYIVDMGFNTLHNRDTFIPNTGCIWRVIRSMTNS